MNIRQRQKGIAILIVVVIIAVVGIAYLLLSSNLLKTNKDNGLLSTNNTSTTLSDNKVLQAACKNAINDYPEWTKADTDLIIWENPDKSFNFRNSPEDASAKLDSPVPSMEVLADMDFIGLNEISYTTTGKDSWKISKLKLNGMGAYDKSLVYEKNEPVSYINTSPINRNEYIILTTNGNKGLLKQINTENSKEEILLEIASINTDNLKLSVSPRGTYVYLLQGDSLIFIEIVSKKQIDKISSTKSAVWIGDGYVLYSDVDGTYIYNLKTKEKNKLDKLGSVSGLIFNPSENGIIAYNEKGNTKVRNCQTGQIIKTKEGTEIKTLTSERTAITQKGDQFGYWRFKDTDWGVNILEEKSKYVTVWQRY